MHTAIFCRLAIKNFRRDIHFTTVSGINLNIADECYSLISDSQS
jgi:hypothetical protein